MAIQTYTVTVASGSLYGGGTGNVFYLDGARNSTGPGTVSWVNGATLRFDQSEGTNDGHPLIFSTNTSTSGIISSGVTYYLDGASNQSSYTNTTSFNAASTRYVEITPSSETDFFYLCYVHGIGMGGIMDITQSTWGALSWNAGQWSDQTDVDLDITGLQLNSSLGDSDEFADRGWGGNTWSHGNWGEVNETDVAVTGSELQSSIDQVAAFPEFGWGGQVWNSSNGGWGDLQNVLIGATGQQLQTNIGEEGIEGEINAGWGRKTWNNAEGWGIAGTLQADGIQLQTNIGEEDLSGEAIVSATGIPSAFLIGTADGVSVAEATGSQLQTSITGPQEINGNATVDLTGIQLTGTLGSLNITPWNEVDLGVNNTWTEVDLAA